MRRRSAPKRQMLPDPKFGSDVIAKLVNHVMRSGKKSVAEAIVYNSIDDAIKKLKSSKEKIGDSEAGENSAGVARLTPVAFLEKALDQVRPNVEVKSRRVGGSTYQVPVEVDMVRGVALSMRWIIEAAKKRQGQTMLDSLSAELVDAFCGRGTAVKKRDDVLRMAKANQAFAHYRW